MTRFKSFENALCSYTRRGWRLRIQKRYKTIRIYSNEYPSAALVRVRNIEDHNFYANPPGSFLTRLTAAARDVLIPLQDVPRTFPVCRHSFPSSNYILFSSGSLIFVPWRVFTEHGSTYNIMAYDVCVCVRA